MSYARFLYDNINIITVDVIGGGFVDNSMLWNTSGNSPSISNEIRLIDEKIDKQCTISSGDAELSVYKAGAKISAVALSSINLFAFYLPTVPAGITVKLYASTLSNSGYQQLAAISSLTTEWNVIGFDVTSVRYFVVQLESASVFNNTAINDVLIGNQYIFTHRFRSGITLPKSYLNINESPTPGINFTTNVGDGVKEWNKSIGGLDADEIDDIAAFKDVIKADFRKFIYSEDTLDGPYWWVKATGDSFIPKNIRGIWSMPFTLEQQLI